jgi:UDP-glucose 4-epimerase
VNKIVVFGGTGYIGGHVAEELIMQGHEVTVYDLRRPEWMKGSGHFVQGDLEDFDKILEVTKGKDVVYNFAGIADIGEAGERRLLTVRTNILGCANILEACAENKIKKFIFASTVYVYSDKGSFYRITKQAAELLVEEYSKKFGFDYTILRYGSLYGGRAQKWNGLRRYIESILREGKINLKNGGGAKRDYIHVYDAMRMSVECIESKYNGQSLLITGTQSITLNELVNMIGEIIGKRVMIEHSTETADHYEITPYRYHPRAGTKITRNEFVDFGQGILEVIHEVYEDLKNERRP